MIQKINTQAFENPTKNINGRVYLTRSFLLNNKTLGLSRGFLIPDDFIAEVESFVKRNLIKIPINEEEFLYKSCTRCLKAHIMKKSTEFGLDKGTISFLEQMLGGETGHHGHYMDEDELIRVD
jgi:hypothetical protein